MLKALKREAEITPRLEEAAKRDSKNVPLQYVLADRYRETGQIDKADALYKSLLTSQPTPRTYAALAKSLYERKKAADLLRVICEAMKVQGSPEAKAVTPQVQRVVLNDELAAAMLDSGLSQLSTTRPACVYNVALPAQTVAWLNADRSPCSDLSCDDSISWDRPVAGQR